jgi:hypothetical protein
MLLKTRLPHAPNRKSMAVTTPKTIPAEIADDLRGGLAAETVSQFRSVPAPATMTPAQIREDLRGAISSHAAIPERRHASQSPRSAIKPAPKP